MGNTCVLPSHETSQSLVSCFSGVSLPTALLSHSTRRILVPSLPLSVSNSNRDKAEPDAGEVGVSTTWNSSGSLGGGSCVATAGVGFERAAMVRRYSGLDGAAGGTELQLAHMPRLLAGSRSVGDRGAPDKGSLRRGGPRVTQSPRTILRSRASSLTVEKSQKGRRRKVSVGRWHEGEQRGDQVKFSLAELDT